jgi:hypothetical protein
MIADSIRLTARGRRLAVSALLGCTIALVAVGCHKVPFEDLWDAPQQMEIDGRTFTLDGGALRNYFPGGPNTSGSPLMAIVTMTGSDTTMPFPSTLHADRVWVIRSPSEV